MKIRYIVLVLSTVFTLISCNSKPKNFDYGKVENNTYFNSFFDMQMGIPSNWSVHTKDQIDQLQGRPSDDSEMKPQEVIPASKVKSASLLAVFKYEIGTQVDFNPSFMISVENLKAKSGIKTGEDYLLQTRKVLVESRMQFDEVDEKCTKETIGNQDFYKMKASKEYKGMQVTQEYYSTLKNGFSLTVILSYINEDQKEELKKNINSMKWGK